MDIENVNVVPYPSNCAGEENVGGSTSNGFAACNYETKHDCEKNGNDDDTREDEGSIMQMKDCVSCNSHGLLQAPSIMNDMFEGHDSDMVNLLKIVAACNTVVKSSVPGFRTTDSNCDECLGTIGGISEALVTNNLAQDVEMCPLGEELEISSPVIDMAINVPVEILEISNPADSIDTVVQDVVEATVEVLKTDIVTDLVVNNIPVDYVTTTVPMDTMKTNVEVLEMCMSRKAVDNSVPVEALETSVPVETLETAVSMEALETNIPVEALQSNAPVDSHMSIAPVSCSDCGSII